MLLVLDNCEHVVEATARLVDGLLQRLPLLRVLTTSREPIGVEDERLYPVRTLELPEADADFPAATASPAVRLFIDRATAALPDFALSESNSADVRAIVRSLDGVPLAIELAAARVRSLPLPDLSARLTDRFRLLTNSTRHAVPRHRTLHAAVACGWELLTAAEAAAARHFSIFAGGATLDAIIRVCGPDAIDTVTSLVTKSLVDLDGQRYRMAETIRVYATAELTAAGDADEAHASTPTASWNSLTPPPTDWAGVIPHRPVPAAGARSGGSGARARAPERGIPGGRPAFGQGARTAAHTSLTATVSERYGPHWMLGMRIPPIQECSCPSSRTRNQLFPCVVPADSANGSTRPARSWAPGSSWPSAAVICSPRSLAGT
ncbi:hypothetical protein [Nocardia sp. NPDC051981]|uniref:ATP-binding protein n=1 Tax=Nocardia sp. NPDC051981 TaxID=3155417 RepID=UPI0034337686